MNPQNKPDWLLLIPACAAILLSVFEQLVVFLENPLGRTPPALGAALLLFIFIFRAIPTYRLYSTQEKWLFIFMLASGLSFFANLKNEPMASGLSVYISWLQSGILFFMLAYIAGQSQTSSKLMLVSFIGCAILMVLFSVMERIGFGDLSSSETRVGYEGVNLNRQAFVYGVSALVACWVFLEVAGARIVTQVAMLGLFAVLASSLFLTGSRTGVGAFGVGLVSLVLLSGWRRFSGRVVVGSAIACGIALAMLLNSEVVLNRFSRTIEGEDYGIRDVLLAAAWSLSKESPLVGYGSYGYAALGAVTGREIIDAHNAHFQIILMVGYPVYLIWLSFMISTFVTAWRFRNHPIGRISFAAMMLFWTFTLTGSLVSSKFYWISMALIIGAKRAVGQQESLNHHYPGEAYGQYGQNVTREGIIR